MAITNTHEEEHGPVLEATEARSGRRGLHVLWILVISMALAVIALFGLLAVEGHRLSGPGGQTAQQPAPAHSTATQQSPARIP